MPYTGAKKKKMYKKVHETDNFTKINIDGLRETEKSCTSLICETQKNSKNVFPNNWPRNPQTPWIRKNTTHLTFAYFSRTKWKETIIPMA